MRPETRGQTLSSSHVHGIALQAEAEDAQRQAEAKYEHLAQAYGELKEAWETRGPRDEDVEALRALQAALEERAAQLASADQRFHELRNVRSGRNGCPAHAVGQLCGSAHARLPHDCRSIADSARFLPGTCAQALPQTAAGRALT